jgi:cytochrome b561
MSNPSQPTRHILGTRLFHAGLALAVIIQLASSQFMQTPRPNRPPNSAFDVHEYSGLAAFAFIFGFWVVLAFRRQGTEHGLLLPWFSAARRAALWSDIKTQLRTLKSLRLPVYEDNSPLASAVHGLGLLLMTAMAGSGVLYYLTATADGRVGSFVGLAMEVHGLLGNVVWAYLIGHASLAIIHHYTQGLDLRVMWSLRRAKESNGAKQ